jgi:hypothetical protein
MAQSMLNFYADFRGPTTNMGLDYWARKIVHGCWSGKQPWQSKSFMLLVRQTTTKIQSPPLAGGILIEHWEKKIV